MGTAQDRKGLKSSAAPFTLLGVANQGRNAPPSTAGIMVWFTYHVVEDVRRAEAEDEWIGYFLE